MQFYFLTVKEYYMKKKEIPIMKSSIALTLLSLAECVTYIVASFLGGYLKDRLVYVNVISSSCLALICIVWPLIDVTYVLILAIAIGEHWRVTVCYKRLAHVKIIQTAFGTEVRWIGADRLRHSHMLIIKYIKK
jgi:hypothetical protein